MASAASPCLRAAVLTIGGVAAVPDTLRPCPSTHGGDRSPLRVHVSAVNTRIGELYSVEPPTLTLTAAPQAATGAGEPRPPA